MPTRPCALLFALGMVACKGGTTEAGHRGADDATDASSPRGGDAGAPSDAATVVGHLPLERVGDIALPGGATRFDYQALDTARRRLVLAHMGDGTVLFVDIDGGTVLQEVPGVPVARGVAIAEEAGLVFVTSSPSTLVILDADSMSELGRAATGNGPDGVAWDPADHIVGVSDQGDGALSLIADSGNGARRQVPLGSHTGNVVFDAGRGWFWVAVEATAPPDQLVAVDPVSAQVTARIDLGDCTGAHGARLHHDGQSAFVACEGTSTLVRVDLDGRRIVGSAPTGAIPDVLAVDPALGWLYVASESSELTVVDLAADGVSLVGRDQPGTGAHSVAVDPETHRVFFPLMVGDSGTPVLRVLRPSGLSP